MFVNTLWNLLFPKPALTTEHYSALFDTPDDLLMIPHIVYMHDVVV